MVYFGVLTLSKVNSYGLVYFLLNSYPMSHTYTHGYSGDMGGKVYGWGGKDSGQENYAWVNHDEVSIAADGAKTYSYEMRLLEKKRAVEIGGSIDSFIQAKVKSLFGQ